MALFLFIITTILYKWDYLCFFQDDCKKNRRINCSGKKEEHFVIVKILESQKLRDGAMYNLGANFLVAQAALNVATGFLRFKSRE